MKPIDHFRNQQKPFQNKILFNAQDLFDFAKSYADAEINERLNALSDDLIKDKIEKNSNLSDRYGSAFGLVNWVKNKIKSEIS